MTAEVAIYGLAILLVTFVVRYIVVFTVYPLTRLATKGKSISTKDAFLVGISGMIRGAISLALVQKLSYTENTASLIPIVQFVVICTIFIFTPLNPSIYGCVLKEPSTPKPRQLTMAESGETQAGEGFRLVTEESCIGKKPSPITSNNQSNLPLKTEGYEGYKKKLTGKKGCAKYFKLLDEFILKPFLIYDYENRASEIRKEKENASSSGINQPTWKNKFYASHFKRNNNAFDNFQSGPLVRGERVDSIGQEGIFGFVGQSSDLNKDDKMTLGMGSDGNFDRKLALGSVMERASGEVGDRTDENIPEGFVMEPSWERQRDLSTPSDKPIELSDKK